MSARYKKLYQEKIAHELMKEFKYKSFMQVPRLLKITLNMGIGRDAVTDKKIVEHACSDLKLISGQKPVITHAKNSIAGFKLREGMAVGCKVTLRRDPMYEFLDRLITVAMPRIRDFRGVSVRSFDGQGNYSFGIKEQIVFPEIDYDKIDKIRGLDITITMSAMTDAEGRALLAAFKFPFKD